MELQGVGLSCWCPPPVSPARSPGRTGYVAAVTGLLPWGAVQGGKGFSRSHRPCPAGQLSAVGFHKASIPTPPGLWGPPLVFRRPGHRLAGLVSRGGHWAAFVVCFEAVGLNRLWIGKRGDGFSELTCSTPQKFYEVKLDAPQHAQWLLTVPANLLCTQTRV